MADVPMTALIAIGSALVGGAVAWGALQSAVTQLRELLAELRAEVRELRSENKELRGDIGEIKTAIAVLSARPAKDTGSHAATP